jgi:hypothetical protein
MARCTSHWLSSELPSILNGGTLPHLTNLDFNVFHRPPLLRACQQQTPACAAMAARAPSENGTLP